MSKQNEKYGQTQEREIWVCLKEGTVKTTHIHAQQLASMENAFFSVLEMR